MGQLEQSLLKVLYRLAPKPTLGEAMQIFRIPEVQNVALEVATLQREDAVENNMRLMELGYRPPLNHRAFLVGGVGVGITPDPHQPGLYEWFAFSSWNTKRYPTGHPDDDGKECAERVIGKRMLARKCTCLVGLAVVGVLNEGSDGRSGKNGPGPTLDPCEACRDDMRGEFHQLYRLGTLILTEHPVTHKRSKARTIKELMDHHGENWWEPSHKIVGLIRGR